MSDRALELFDGERSLGRLTEAQVLELLGFVENDMVPTDGSGDLAADLRLWLGPVGVDE